MANFFQKIRQKVKPTVKPASGSASAATSAPHKRSARAPFRSTTFIILRVLQLFFTLSVLGGTIRLAFFKFVVYGDDSPDIQDDLNILNTKFQNPLAYYFMIGVSAWTLLFVLFTIFRYFTRKLAKRSILITDALAFPLWLAASIIWGIEVKKYLGFGFNNNTSSNYDYWYVRSAHTGIMGIAIITFLTFIVTFSVGLTRKPRTYNSLPEQHDYSSSVPLHSYQQPQSARYDPEPPVYGGSGFAGGAPVGHNASYYAGGNTFSAPAGAPPGYVPGSGEPAVFK